MARLVAVFGTLFVLVGLILITSEAKAQTQTVTIGDEIYSLTPWRSQTLKLKGGKKVDRWHAIIGEIGSRHILSTMTLKIVAHTVVVHVVSDCPRKANGRSLTWVLGESLGTIRTCDGARATSDRPQLFEKAIPALPPEIVRFLEGQKEVPAVFEQLETQPFDPSRVDGEIESV